MSRNNTIFKALHDQIEPLFLFNIWDAGSAKIIAKNGVAAIATSSWSVAEAQGYSDGQAIPFSEFATVIKNIVNAVNVPVTVDFESGYAEDIKDIQKNLLQLINSGISGINFEDQNITSGGIYDVTVQSNRIAALRDIADKNSADFFINARTDLFLQESNGAEHKNLISAAIMRGREYKKAGADGFFIPGTTDSGIIREICSAVDLPVNVMDLSDSVNVGDYKSIGVKRISIGPKSWISFCDYLSKQYTNYNNK